MLCKGPAFQQERPGPVSYLDSPLGPHLALSFLSSQLLQSKAAGSLPAVCFPHELHGVYTGRGLLSLTDKGQI